MPVYRVEGVQQAAAAFQRLAAGMQGEVVARAALAGGLPVMADAKRRAPVLTGNLRRSIHEELEPGASQTRAGALVGTNVEYADYVERGTRYMSARPYLRPALDENRAQVEAAVRVAFVAQIRRLTL